MTLHKKSVVLILGTLIIGIICGALLSGIIRMNRGDGFSGPPSPERFSRYLLNRIVQPDDSQRSEIQQIMDDYRPQFEDTMLRHREEVRALIDSLQQEIDPLLTDQQRERLQERRDRGRRFLNKSSKLRRR
mgnify:CR=1 FL=1